MISAWATANHLVFGQIVTDAKSNEITAIPALLQMLDLRGSTVSIDPMGWQKDIAQTIVDSGGNTANPGVWGRTPASFYRFLRISSENP